ncbi:hypothetical protein SUGI_0732870 [Cryptomeria japonica]|nr:hypothetical protein SUGI_0732870 [Cryptomeria japonica]
MGTRLKLCGNGRRFELCNSEALVPLRRLELCSNGDKIEALREWREDLSSAVLVPLTRLELCGNGDKILPLRGWENICALQLLSL